MPRKIELDDEEAEIVIDALRTLAAARSHVLQPLANGLRLSG